MEIKIGKIQLSITNNGTPKAYIWADDKDFNSMSQAIELIGNEVIYIATRKPGETVELVQKGKWINIVVPKAFADAVNTAGYERVRLLFERAMHGIDVAVNGVRSSIDLDTAKVLLTDDLETYLKLQDNTIKVLKDTNTTYSKEVVKNMSLPISEQTLNPYNEINRLTLQSINNITKEYRIQNNGEEVKETKIKQTTKT